MMNASFPSILLDEAEEHPPHDLLSKADFLHAVETLAGNLAAEFTAGDMESIFVACPYDTWKQTFGEPRGIQERHGIQAWEQPCSDGLVHCVGYFEDVPHDGQRVILTRICLF
jgi:hypothetical protein